mgnify:FL=1
MHTVSSGFGTEEDSYAIMRSLLCITSISLLSICSATALTAVIEVNESPYYSANKNNFYGGASLTNFYAPLPVFFEGWKSSPRNDIVEYLWDFGDGSPRMRGFNAAHVYEEPGVYTATLVVTNSAGAVATDTITINVQARTGTTYYVDSVAGQDFFNGTSPATPWRTATKAFEGASASIQRYGPGDQILFRRGQTFSMSKTVEFGNTKRYGFKFGAFGEGARPIIQNTGTFSGNRMFNIDSGGLAHLSIVDLDFRMRNETTGDIASFWFSSGEVNQLLFLRCSLHQFNGGFIFSHGKTNNLLAGAFIVDSTTFSSSFHHIFANASRMAILDSRFDLSGNHVAYISWLDRGVIQGNTFSRPANGRTALRVSGDAGFTNPSNNIYIANNFMRGWVDPVIGSQPHGDGTRYNWVLVQLAPNTSSNQSIEWVVFEDNTIMDAEQHLNIGSYENLVVRRNLMYSPSTWQEGRVMFGSRHGFDRRPLRNIAVHDNFIVNANPTSNPYELRMFEVREYTGPTYQGSNLHQNLSMLNNHVITQNGTILQVASNKQAQLNQVTSNWQRINTGQQANTYEYNSTKYNLQGWRNLSGQDFQTTVRGLGEIPSRPVCSSPEIVDEGPITVTYSGAQDNSGTGLKEVVLWYKRNHGSWIRSELTSPGPTGSFAFEPILGSGSYFFWAQAEDNAGNRSLPPTTQPGWAGTTNRTTLAQFGDTSTFHGQGSINGNLPDPGDPQGPDPQEPPIDPGLLAYYKLDNPPIVGVPDYSGNDLDGFVIPPDVPTFTNGYLNGAYRFESGDSVVLPNLDIPGGDFTISAWINPSGFNEPLQDNRIISKAIDITENGHWWMLSTFGTDAGTRLRFRVKPGSILSPTTTLIASVGEVRIGIWQHVAATYQNGQMRLYLNGALVGQATTDILPVSKASFAGVMIGNQPGDVPEWEDKSWNGMIDDVRIYSYALSPPQIAELHNVNQSIVPNPSDTPFPEPGQGVPLAAWPVLIALGAAGFVAVRRWR